VDGPKLPPPGPSLFRVNKAGATLINQSTPCKFA
jgi:hypothetical protein